MDAKKTALELLSIEIDWKIDLLAKESKGATIGELFYFLTIVHLARVAIIIGRHPKENERTTILRDQVADEVYKYIIQCVLKFGTKILAFKNGAPMNETLIRKLTEYATSVMSKFETYSFMTRMSEFSILEGGKFKFSMKNASDWTTDDGKKWKYGLRVSQNTFEKKGKGISKEEVYKRFQLEYAEVEHLFIKGYGLTISEFLNLVDFLITTVTTNIEKASFTKDEDGTINMKRYQNIMKFGYALFVPRSAIAQQFGPKIQAALESIIFKEHKFNEKELRFHQLARQPLLNYGDLLVVSPELLLDSIIVNTHFSFLESRNTHEEYKGLASNIFLDKVSKIFSENGYVERFRNLDLLDGNKKLGDIDLVFENSDGHWILVEAKNHFLPLDVYFNDENAVETRLIETKNWEQKVERRNNYLKTNYKKYSIGANFTYMFVTRSPEILTHFSTYKVLDLFELEKFLIQHKSETDIEVLIDKIYGFNDEELRKNDPSLFDEWFKQLTFLKE